MSDSEIKNYEEYIKELQKKFKIEMPRIKREIEVYESRLKEGTLNPNPKVSPQFRK